MNEVASAVDIASSSFKDIQKNNEDINQFYQIVNVIYLFYWQENYLAISFLGTFY